MAEVVPPIPRSEMYDETAKQAERPIGALDEAVERCRVAEKRTDEALYELSERLQAVLRPDSGEVPKEATPHLDAVRHQPSLIVEQLVSHAEVLDAQADRIRALTGRLDT